MREPESTTTRPQRPRGSVVAAACWVLALFALLLPARTALALGDVVVVADPLTGRLDVTGGDGDEAIEITSAGPEDSFVIAGQEGTTVNGLPSVTVTGVQRFVVKMGAGSDSVTLTRIRIGSHLNLNGGSGRDALVMDEVTVAGITKVYGGRGDDRIVAKTGSEFRRRLMIYAGDGNDAVRVQDVDCRNRLYVDAGRGHDDVDLVDSDFGEKAEVKGFAGNDDLDVDDCDFDEAFQVRMSDGRDDVRIEDSHFDDDVELDGGDGDDDELDFDGGNHFDRDLEIWGFED